MKRHKWMAWTVLGILILFVAQYLIVTVVVPLAPGDGVGSYSGTKKEAARKAVDTTRTYIDNKERWAYVLHADDVHATTAQEKAQFCIGDRAHITNEPTDAHYYTVVVSTKSLLNYAAPTTETLPGCASSPASW